MRAAKRAKKAPVAAPAPPPPAAVAALPGHEVVGRRLRVWWSDDAAWYAGEVKSFDGEKHAIRYDDGEEEALDLSRERHEFVASLPPLATPQRTHRGAPARCYAKGTPQSRGAGVGTSSSSDDESSDDDNYDMECYDDDGEPLQDNEGYTLIPLIENKDYTEDEAREVTDTLNDLELDESIKFVDMVECGGSTMLIRTRQQQRVG